MDDDMMDIPDETIARIAGVLRPLPDIDPEAVARVLVAVAAERSRSERSPLLRHRTRIVLLGTLAASLIAAVALARVAARTSGAAREGVIAAAAAVTPTTPSTRPVALASDNGDASTVSAVPVTLVVHAESARRVSVVGDFTGWDDRRVAMTRDPVSGAWMATVMVRPGRHVYAFVADDSVWMRDPAAPTAPDADFGRPGSLLLVGRP